MNLYIRLLILLLKRLFRRPARIDIFDACKTSFIVNPFDLDVNFHMNNGRYLSLMDLGRVDLMIKSGVFWTLIKDGYYPVVVAESIRFKKSLDPFQSFHILTQVDSLDEKDFFISQKFYRGELLVAEGYMKGRFKKRGRKGSVSTQELLALIGAPERKPFYSERAQLLNATQQSLAQEAAQNL